MPPAPPPGLQRTPGAILRRLGFQGSAEAGVPLNILQCVGSPPTRDHLLSVGSTGTGNPRTRDGPPSAVGSTDVRGPGVHRHAVLQYSACSHAACLRLSLPASVQRKDGISSDQILRKAECFPSHSWYWEEPRTGRCRVLDPGCCSLASASSQSLHSKCRSLQLL